MPFVDDLPVTQQSNPPPPSPSPSAGDDDLYAPFHGAGIDRDANLAANLDQGDTTYADYGHALMSGVYGTGAALSQLVSSNAQGQYTRDYAAATAESQRQAQQASQAALTPAAKASLDAPWLSAQTAAHPLRAIGLGVAEQAAPTIAMVAPAVVAGPAMLGLGPLAVAGAGALGGAAVEAGQAESELAGQGVSQADIDKSGVGWKSGLIGAAAGGFGPITGLVGRGVMTASEGALVSQALRGGIEGSAVMGAQAGAQTAVSGEAEHEAGLRGPVTPAEVIGGAASGAGVGFGLGILGGARGREGTGHDASERPREDAPPQNEPVKQPSLEGTERDGTQTGGAAHIERATPAKRAEEANKRDMGAAAASAGGTGPALPADKVDPAQRAALDASAKGAPSSPDVTLESKSQPEPVNIQSADVTGAPTQPAGAMPDRTTPEAARTPETGGEPYPYQPPPSEPSSVAVVPPRRASDAVPTPDLAADLVRQHAELLDPNHPRQAAITPAGAQPIEITTDKSRYGQARLPDGSGIQYDRRTPSELTKPKIDLAYANGRLDDLLHQEHVYTQPGEQATGPTRDVIQTAGDRFKQAQADIAARRAELDAAERGEFKQPASAEDQRTAMGEAARGAPVGAEDPLAGAAKLAENKSGVELHQKPDGSYLKRTPAGEVKPVTGKTARIVFPEAFTSSRARGVTPEGAPTLRQTQGAAEFGTIRRQEIGQAMTPPAEGRPRISTVDRNGRPIEVTSQRTITARQAVAELHDPTRFSAVGRAINERLLPTLLKLAGDTPVHFISHEDMLKTGVAARGMYDGTNDHILLNAERAGRETVPHELFHAATSKALRSNPKLANLMQRLAKEISAQASRLEGDPDTIQGLRKVLADPEELLARLMTSPAFQELFKSTKISDDLARDIGIPAWRKKSMWNGALEVIRKALDMEPRDVSAIEGAMAISEKALDHRVEMLRTLASRSDAAMLHPEDTPSFQRLDDESQGEPRAEDLRDGVAPARYGAAMDKAVGGVKAAIGDIGPASRGVTALTRHLLESPRDMIARAYERQWGAAKPADRWADETGAANATRQAIVDRSTSHMDRLAKFSAVKPVEFNKLSELLVSASVHGADARDDLGVGKNAHIKVNAKKPENSPSEHIDAIHGNPEDRAAYKALSPEGQKLYDGTMDMLREMRAGELKAGRAELVEKLERGLETSSLSTDYKYAVHKVMQGKELDPEEKDKYGDDPNIRALHDYDVLAAKSERGAYFPLDHGDGGHVVEGEHVYSLPDNGRRFSNDPKSPDYHRIVFGSKKDAFDFDPKRPTERNTAHYVEDSSGKRSATLIDDDGEPIIDPATGKPRRVTSDEATSTPGVKTGEEYHVLVNPRDVRFVSGPVEGERVRQAMLDLQNKGEMKNVSQVQPRKNQEPWQYGVNSAHVGALIKRLDKMDLTDIERTRMTDAIKHVSAASIAGAKLARAALARDRTGGAGMDIIKSLDDYRWASAAHEAMAQHRNVIEQALQEVKDYADANKSHPDAAQIRAMANLLDARTHSFQKDGLGNVNMSKQLSALTAYTSMLDLVSPAFFGLHQLHIPLVVIPDLAAESNPATAARISSSIYRRAGLTEVGMAVKATGRALWKSWRYDHQPTNFIDALKNELKLDASEKAMIDWLVAHDFMHSTGVDFSQAYGGTSLLGKFASKTRNFSSEFIGSADAFNRVNSALMYFKLAGEKGLTGTAAFKYAADGIVRTQGQFSAFNKANLFRHPAMNAILQYKQFPVLLMRMVGKAMLNSFGPIRDATGKLTYKGNWETRARALKTFAYMSLAATAMSGLRGGAAWPIRLTDDLLHLLGLTDGWDAHMDALQQSLAEQLGPTSATAITQGLGSLAGLYLGHRGGISDPVGVNYLLETAKDSGDILKWAAGAPYGTVSNLVSAVGAAKNGDAAGVAMHLLPRLVTDPIKGYSEDEGVRTQTGKTISPPVSAVQRVEKALGFTSITEVQAREARAAVGREQAQAHNERKAVLDSARSGDMAAALRAMNSFNRSNPANRITPAELQRARTAKPTLLGYAENARNRADINRRIQAYGLQ